MSATSHHKKYHADEAFSAEEYAGRWDEIWGAGLKVGELFDAGTVAKSLFMLLSSGQVAVKGMRVLVPGCGRGYDVETFARMGAHATGLELSATATQAAGEYMSSALASDPEALSRASVQQGDFLKFSDPMGPYDVGYDYTFGCALHPSMRADWAASWARLIKPGGKLITLVFPVDPDMDPDMGPPYPVNPRLYTSLLEPAGFSCESMEPVAPENSFPKRAGKEVMGVWVRK